MNKDIVLQTKRLLMRPLQISDISDDYVQGLNDPEVNRYLFDAQLFQQTRKTVEDFVKSNLNGTHSFLLGLFDKQKQELIGTVRVSAVSPIHFSCTVGICIFQKTYWSRGLGTEAISNVTAYLFGEMGMHYVEAGAYEENNASITMFKKAGFEVKAILKDKYRYDTEFVPVVILAKINADFDLNRLKGTK